MSPSPASQFYDTDPITGHSRSYREPRAATIKLRITRTQYETLRAHAAGREMTVSAFVEEAIGIAIRTDSIHLNHRPKVRPRPRRKADAPAS